MAIKEITNKYSRKFRKWRDKTLLRGGLTLDQQTGLAEQLIGLYEQLAETPGMSVAVEDIFSKAEEMLASIGIKFKL